MSGNCGWSVSPTGTVENTASTTNYCFWPSDQVDVSVSVFSNNADFPISTVRLNNGLTDEKDFVFNSIS